MAINSKGELVDHDQDGTPLTSYFVVTVVEKEPEGLYRQAKRGEEQCPDLTFAFERDPEGKSITYSVRPQSETSQPSVSSQPQTLGVPVGK